MRRFIAILTFTCFLAVSTAEGRVLTIFVKSGCSLELVPAARVPGRASGCCSSLDYGREVYRCVPFSKLIVTLKNMIDYRQANSIAARGSDELSTPVINAVLKDPRDFSTLRPAGKVMEETINYNETFVNYSFLEDLVFIHPQISITVLRL